MSAAKNAGFVRFDLEALRDMLGLSEEVRITYVEYDASSHTPQIRLLLEGAGLPLVHLGELIPYVAMEFEDGDSEIDEPRPRFKGFRD